MKQYLITEDELNTIRERAVTQFCQQVMRFDISLTPKMIMEMALHEPKEIDLESKVHDPDKEVGSNFRPFPYMCGE